MTSPRDNLAELLEALRSAQDDLDAQRERSVASARALQDRRKAFGDGMALCGIFELGDWVLIRRSECSKEQIEQAQALQPGGVS